MHTRRIATFILGVWMGCSVLIGLMEIEGPRLAARTNSEVSEDAGKIVKKLDPGETALMFRYVALEQSRQYRSIWEQVELGLAVVMAVCLFMGTQKRIFPMVVCGMLFLLVVFEHFGISPELTFRSRAVDFPPGNATYATQMRAVALAEIYAGVEAVKMLVSAVLASYLFVFRARSRSRKDALSDAPVLRDRAIG